MTKVRAPRPGEKISWRPRRLAPTAPAPKPVAPSTPKAPPVDAGYEKQKREWLQGVKDAESPPSTHWLDWQEDKKKPQGLLDDLPDNLSPENRHTIILTRIDHMRDS